MFIGHYGPAFALKAAAPAAPLWSLVAAVQAVDFVWAGLVLTGVEYGRVEPGFMDGSALVLEHMPYSHSLAGAGAISAAFAAIVALTARAKPALVWAAVALAGLSHWFLDLLVHAPDLTLAGEPPLFGLGLWAYKWPSFALEIALLGAGLWLYVRATTPRGVWGQVAPWAMFAAGLAMELVNKLQAPPATLQHVAATALAAFTVFVALGFWLDRTRATR